MPTIHDVLLMLPSSSTNQVDQCKKLVVELPSISLGFGHLFGGQVFSQSMRAAQFWLDDYRSTMMLNMAHGVFLKSGNADTAVTYEVTPLGLGRTFQRFQVQAIQAGSLIFQALISAQKEDQEHMLLQHQQAMPSIPGPDDGLMTDRELIAKINGQSVVSIDSPIDVRIATPDALLLKNTAHTRYGYWFRFNASGCRSTPMLSQAQHCAFLAYASDYGFLGGLFVPHEPSVRLIPFFLTSLDHSLWYYKPYNALEWAYFEIESPVACQSRGLVTGRIYQDSELVAVVTQEGLLRRRH